MVDIDDGLLFDSKPKKIEILPNENLNKKIKKVLKKMTVDNIRNRKIIEKAFGSLDFKDEYNNSLAHLFIINTDRNYRYVRRAISTLYVNNKTCDKNCNDDTFLQYFIKNFKHAPEILESVYFEFLEMGVINDVDSDGNTLLHNLVLKSMNFSVIRSLYDTHLWNDYGSQKNNNGETFYDILERKYNKIMFDRENLSNDGSVLAKYFGEEDYRQSYNDIEINMEAIKIYYFAHNPSAIFDRFTDDDEQNKKLMDYYAFNILSPPLITAVDIPQRKDILTIIERLLRLGENPNIKDRYGFTFLDYVIENYGELDVIFKAIELALKYGYSINNPNIKSLFIDLNRHNLPYEEELYIFLSRFGYKNIKKDYIGIYDNQEEGEKEFKEFRIRCFRMIFEEEVSKIVLDSTINRIKDDKFFDMIFEIIDSFQPLFDFNNDYEFIKFLIEEIINERNNSINLRTDAVDEKEILNTLVNCVNKKTEEKIAKVLKK